MEGRAPMPLGLPSWAAAPHRLPRSSTAMAPAGSSSSSRRRPVQGNACLPALPASDPFPKTALLPLQLGGDGAHVCSDGLRDGLFAGGKQGGKEGSTTREVSVGLDVRLSLCVSVYVRLCVRVYVHVCYCVSSRARGVSVYVCLSLC